MASAIALAKLSTEERIQRVKDRRKFIKEIRKAKRLAKLEGIANVKDKDSSQG